MRIEPLPAENLDRGSSETVTPQPVQTHNFREHSKITPALYSFLTMRAPVQTRIQQRLLTHSRSFLASMISLDSWPLAEQRIMDGTRYLWRLLEYRGVDRGRD